MLRRFRFRRPHPMFLCYIILLFSLLMFDLLWIGLRRSMSFAISRDLLRCICEIAETSGGPNSICTEHIWRLWRLWTVEVNLLRKRAPKRITQQPENTPSNFMAAQLHLNWHIYSFATEPFSTYIYTFVCRAQAAFVERNVVTNGTSELSSISSSVPLLRFATGRKRVFSLAYTYDWRRIIDFQTKKCGGHPCTRLLISLQIVEYRLPDCRL